MKNSINFRFENKYLLSKNFYFRVINSIRRVSNYDIHSESENTYKVRSLYYDSKDLTAYIDKVNGVNSRDKFRIRSYDIDEKNVTKLKIEMKSKKAQFVYKVSNTISYNDYKFFEKERYFKKIKGLALELFLYNFYKYNLEPTTLVEYDREAYYSKKDNVRFTFDHNVKYALGKNFFLPSKNFKPCYKNAIVFEIKSFQNDIGWLSNLINAHGLRSEPNSKYTKSVEHTVNNIWK